MKKLLLFSFFALAFTQSPYAQTANDGGQDEPVAKFKVEITQSGKYKEYQRLVTLGSGMVYEGSTKQAIVLHDGDLKEDKYSFVSTDSLDVLEPSIQVGWYGNKKGDGKLEMKVYRNGELIDTQNVILKPENSGQVQDNKWSYKAKKK